MPSPDSLPAELEPFARRNALEISDSRWDYDVQRLIDVLDPGSPETLTGSTPVIVTSDRKRPRWLAVALGAAVLVVGALLLLGRGGGDRGDRSVASGAPTASATETTLPAPADGESPAGAPPGAGGQPAGPNQAPVGGRPNPAATSATIPPAVVNAPPKPPAAAGGPAIPQAYAVPNADEVAGTWAGQAYDDQIGFFPMRVEVHTGCAVGSKCGSIYVASNNCRGDLTFLNQTYDGTGNHYEFSVSNFSPDSGPNCREGAGEFLGSYRNGTLAYWTSYGPHATLNPA